MNKYGKLNLVLLTSVTFSIGHPIRKDIFNSRESIDIIFDIVTPKGSFNLDLIHVITRHSHETTCRSNDQLKDTNIIKMVKEYFRRLK